MTGEAEETTLVQCEDCRRAIPVIVGADGEFRPLGTGGDCPVGRHTVTLRGRTIALRNGDARTETPFTSS